ncbi:MAG: DnaJ domain-containing protein [Candidatus Brocadiae bacterium]|nr:DnaJ domain-containing protein [Candidatus Brocadiia bacterium]
MRMPAVNYYELLGVPPDAAPDQIEAAFKQRARKYHPTLHPGDQAAALVYHQLCTAFRVLKNPATRSQYDLQLRRSAAPTPSAAPRTPSAQPSRAFRPPSSRSPVQKGHVADVSATTAAARVASGASQSRAALPHRRRTTALMRARHAIEFAKRVLWWGLSAAVHVMLIWILARWPYVGQAVERVVLPIDIGIRPLVEPEPLDIGHEIIPEEPEDIAVEEVQPDAVEPDPLALNEAEREAALAVVAVEGGPYRMRSAAGRAKAMQGGGATSGSESAVSAGLQWLKAHQLSTGAWKADREETRWANVGLTGLATLAFLGAGHTHHKGNYRRTVGAALAYLKSQQGTDGSICFRHQERRPGQMYLHGIATLALAEAYAMTKDPLLREATQRAVDFLLETQNSTGGWRYYATSSDADSSIAGWIVMALRSARYAGLEVPEKAFDGARKFFASVTDKASGATSYMVNMPPSSPALIAVGLLCNQYLGIDRDDPYIVRAGILINKFPAEWMDTKNPVDIENMPKTHPAANSYYFWYYANLALHQRRGEAWEQWHPQVRKTLIGAQVKKGSEQGSWPPYSRWARVGGRVYSTALAVLTLEVYYRYAPIYREVVDKVLAAYGRALTSYNEFSTLARRRDSRAIELREEAMADLEAYLRLSTPEDGKPTHKRRAKATRLLITLHRHAEDYPKTIALLRSLPKAFPELVKEPAHTRTIADLYLTQARKLAKLGNTTASQKAEAEAMKLYYELVHADPQKNAALELWLAERTFEQQDWDRAVDLYKQRAKRYEQRQRKDERNALAHTYRRIIACYGNLRRHRLAALWLERLEKLLGPTLTIRRERAALAVRLGRYTEARRVYESIVPAVKQWSPEYWQARYDVFRMMIEEGRGADVARRIDTLAARRPDLGGPESRRRLLALRRQAVQPR